jgi:hypothetical protein
VQFVERTVPLSASTTEATCCCFSVLQDFSPDFPYLPRIALLREHFATQASDIYHGNPVKEIAVRTIFISHIYIGETIQFVKVLFLTSSFVRERPTNLPAFRLVNSRAAIADTTHRRTLTLRI